MADRPESLAQLDRYFLAATMAHEYANDLHCELAELHADDVHTRKLLSESAAVASKTCRGWSAICAAWNANGADRSYSIRAKQSGPLGCSRLVGQT